MSAARLADRVARALLRVHGLDGPPRIGVAALNPHAGEQGLFGDEEQRIIGPAVEQGLAEGLELVGPLPCDTLMMRAAAGDFDAVVAMYHDQGHIALKLLGMHRAVNITLGLPIIRTSVAHGTAFDLAWQGRAEWSGMVEAICTAGAGCASKPNCWGWQPHPGRPTAAAGNDSRRPEQGRTSRCRNSATRPRYWIVLWRVEPLQATGVPAATSVVCSGLSTAGPSPPCPASAGVAEERDPSRER